MDIKKELRKPSNLINIGVFVFLVIYSQVAVGSALALFQVAVWASLVFTIMTVVTPWLMDGLGLKDPVDTEVDQ